MRRGVLRAASASLALLAWAAAARAGDAAADAAARARERVREVFRGPEFDPLRDADLLPQIDVDLEWTERFTKWMREALESAFDKVWSVLRGILDWLFGGLRSLFGGGGNSGAASLVPAWVAWTLGVLALALIAWLLIRLFRAHAAERSSRAGALVIGARGGAEEDDALARKPEDWRRSARELAAGGRLRESLRALYLSLLSALHHAGAIDYDRTRTNTDYVRDLRPDHSARPAFASITERFDRSWYGRREPAPEEMDAAMGEADAVLAEFRREVARA